MPVGCPRKFLFDHIADQKQFSSAEEGTDHEGGERRNEHHCDTADDAGDGERQDNADEGIKMIRSQIVGGVDYIGVNLCQSVI